VGAGTVNRAVGRVVGSWAPRSAIRPAAVLFDLDGTLADSFDAIGRALNAALRELRLPPRDALWVRRHVGRGTAELIRDALGAASSAAERQRFGARFLAAYEPIFCEQTPPMPGTRAVLELVARGTGGRMAVVSNKFSWLCQRWLRHWRLDDLIALVAGPDSYGVRKPDPGAVLPVLAALGVAPGDALIVGDMEIDAETGRRAGVPVVGVRNETVSGRAMRASGARAVLYELRDLPGWLAGNGQGWDTMFLATRGRETS
jgi:phosphoglycolate phosphatase